MRSARCIYREENDDTRLEIWDEGDLRSLWFDDVILQNTVNLIVSDIDHLNLLMTIDGQGSHGVI